MPKHLHACHVFVRTSCWSFIISPIQYEVYNDVKQCRLTYRHVHLFHGNHTAAADMELRPKIGSYDT